MKVIELLAKIANGEEVPKKIRYDSDTYYYIEDNREGVCYINTALDEENIWRHFLYNIYTLNDEVEIIEEDKKIEKLETYDIAGNIFLEDYCFKYIPIDKKKLTANEQVFVNKIDEIIDYINGGTNGE